MDIRSGNVVFGQTCPGTLMQDLQRNQPENVAKIKKLQTSFSRYKVTYLCPVACRDLSIIGNFIEAIDALEELSVLNYEHDASALWPAISRHADSLSSLAIHTPPQGQSHVWTPATIKDAADGLPQLKQLEMDVNLDEAESHLAAEPSQQQMQSVIDEVAKMHRLESILINVNLPDASSAFANAHTWDARGSISFPEPNKESCKQLALKIFDKFRANASDTYSLKHLELRFPRRCWDDRGQFWTLAYSFHVRRDEAGVAKAEAEEKWKEYLPPWPKYGGIL